MIDPLAVHFKDGDNEGSRRFGSEVMRLGLEAGFS